MMTSTALQSSVTTQAPTYPPSQPTPTATVTLTGAPIQPQHPQRAQSTRSTGSITPPFADSDGRKPHRNASAVDVAKKFFAQAVSSTSSLALRGRTSPEMPLSHAPRAIGGGISGIPSHAASAQNLAAPRRGSRSRSSSSPSMPGQRNPYSSSDSALVNAPMSVEKPQASTSGGGVTMTIQLAEPVLFLQGLDQNEYNSRTPAMLRGSLILRVAKPTKIKAVTLTFIGRARTEWPEGIPPKKSEYYEEKEIMQHTWPFFNAQFPTAELGHCADSFHPRGENDSNATIGSAISHLARSASPIGITPATSGSASDRRLSLQLSQSRSFSKGEAPNGGVSVSQRGFRVFQPGDYVYNFELPVESCLPETIDVDLGSVKYELEGTIERPGAFRPNLIGKKEVTLIRVPSETNLECTEPIAISRTWEDQLHYDIVISGKSFPLGSSIPIAFKLTPLAKVRCHRIKIFITENIEYACKNKKVHRLDPTRKVQLFEKRAEAPATSAFSGSSVRVISGGGLSQADIQRGQGRDVNNGSDNLLGNLNGDLNIGPTELEFNVKLPGCNAKERERIHFDTTYPNIQVHHWIKIVMRLSKADPNDPSKRRHFEISIDSPFHILSCRATHANTTLPAYNSPFQGEAAPMGACSCPPLSRRNSPRDGSTTTLNTNNPPPPPPHSAPPQPDTNGRYQPARPMHLLRAPSMNPPPFDFDVAPPPLITPPPKYESIVGDREGLADYFARLADETPGDDDSEEEGQRTPSENSAYRRLMPPLTPGGRVARSMDERRTWEPIGTV